LNRQTNNVNLVVLADYKMRKSGNIRKHITELIIKRLYEKHVKFVVNVK